MHKLICAQSDGSAAICRTVQRVTEAGANGVHWNTIDIDTVAAGTVADSLSVDRPRDGLAAVQSIVATDGIAIAVPDAEIIAAIPELARTTGIFAEPAAAAAVAATRQLIARRMIEPDATVVCLITGSGLKDVTRAKTSVAEPTLIDASLEAVRDAMTGA